ncbi:MAG: Zn-ribbon domain-containing OB-fold protein [Acidobacteriota bacterium]
MSSPRAWRHYPQRYRYEAAVCTKCGKVHFPPRLICDACKGREFTTKTMARTGTILTHTVIRTGPKNFADQTPFAVAVVEMDDGPRLTCQVTDLNPGQLAVGLKVRLEFRKIYDEGASGIINYGYKAVPV